MNKVVKKVLSLIMVRFMLMSSKTKRHVLKLKTNFLSGDRWILPCTQML